MLYWLQNLSDGGDFFNLFRYITFRAGGAFFTALVFGFLFGRPLINLLRQKQKHGQPIRDDGPESHLETKAGTPTMGGVLILGALITSTVFWARLDIGYVWLVLFVTLSFGLIGFLDDYQKVTRNSHSGSLGRIALQAIFNTPEGKAAMTQPVDGNGMLVFETSEITTPDFSGAGGATQIVNALRGGLSQDLLQQYLVDLQAKLGVNINEKLWTEIQDPTSVYQPTY